MKFKDIYVICKKNYDNISTCKLVVDEEMRECYFHNENRMYDILSELAGIEYLRFSVECFKKEETKLDGFDFGTRPNTDKYEIAKAELLSKMKAIINIYESLGLSQEETIGIDVKLPVTGDFSDFKKVIDDLEFIFTKCPFFGSKTENLRFDGLDIGSTWLTFAITGTSVLVTGSILLNNIAAFIDKCIALKSHRLTIQQQKEEIEKSRREQKEKEEIITYLDRVFKIQVENAIKELEEIAEYELSDGDEKGRVVQSFEKLEKLIDKGLQIYSTIDSPPEVKLLFKPLEMKYLSIVEELEAIEKKDNEEE